jgi:hypothetical protein
VVKDALKEGDMAQRKQHVEEADVRLALTSLEQRIRQRRQLMGADTAAATDDDVRAVADNWFVSAHLPITWETPVIGRALALAKRVTRLLLRWYINPIVDQQNDFNAAVSRAFVRVTAQQEALAQAVAALEQRVRALEERGSGGAGERGSRGAEEQGSDA